jgi:chromosome segregation ATPase
VRKVKAWAWGAAVAAGLALGGCQTNDDPAKGGFFSGVANLSDGTYAKRQQERQQALENEQDANQQKQRELERTNAQRDAVAAERAQAEQKYAALTAEIKSLKSRLSKAKGEHTALQREADALQAKIDLLKADSFTPDDQKKAQLDALRKEKADLEGQIDSAIGK